MENYKLIENRADLSPEQIAQGMNFAQLKTNVAVAKAALLKSLIIKGLIGCMLVASSIIVYKVYNSPTTKKDKLVSTQSASEQTQKASPIIVDSVQTGSEENKSETVKNEPPIKAIGVVSENKHTEINTTANSAPSNAASESNKPEPSESTIPKDSANKEMKDSDWTKKTIQSKYNKYASCHLWKTKNFCSLPKKINLSKSFDEDNASYDAIKCQQVNNAMSTLTAVWISIDVKGRNQFEIESQLQNITLIDSITGKTQHPMMIAATAGGNFFGQDFKAKRFVAHYEGKMDIFLLFKKADIGDVIKIKNFTEVVIRE